MFNERNGSMSEHEHEVLNLFDSEQPDVNASFEHDQGDSDVRLPELPQRADAHSMVTSRVLRRCITSAAFLTGVLTAVLVIPVAGEDVVLLTREPSASVSLPSLPASPLLATVATLPAVDAALLAAAEVPDGALAITSNPVGADVFIDGARVGTTPLVLPNQREGVRSIRIEAMGREPWAAAVQIVAEREVSVRADLNVVQPASPSVAVDADDRPRADSTSTRDADRTLEMAAGNR